jgi:hypothetical protein
LAKNSKAKERDAVDKEVKPESHEWGVVEQPFVEDKCA